MDPSEIDGWLDQLQTGVQNSLAKKEKIVISLGMCYSGSFIPDLVGPNRVIMSSSSPTELSVRSPGTAESRQGDYFTALLFQEMSQGNSLLDSFIATRNQIGTETSDSNLSPTSDSTETNETNLFNFSNNGGQHPLLEDDGEGIGSFQVSGNSGDGQLAKHIYIKPSKNSIGVGKISKVSGTEYLCEPEDQPNLSVSMPNDFEGEVYMTVKKLGEAPKRIVLPNISVGSKLELSNLFEQRIIDLTNPQISKPITPQLSANAISQISKPITPQVIKTTTPQVTPNYHSSKKPSDHTSGIRSG